MSGLETGLLLPIRFYRTLAEQDRYKNQSLGVALTELNYPYVDCTKLAPFQVNVSDSFTEIDFPMEYSLTAICVDTGERINLPINITHWSQLIYGDTYSLSYFGTDDFTGLLSNALYYLEIYADFEAWGVTYFYSDLFRTFGCESVGDNIDLFVAKSSGGESIKVEDLRIK